jgi:hypothetical protein
MAQRCSPFQPAFTQLCSDLLTFTHLYSPLLTKKIKICFIGGQKATVPSPIPYDQRPVFPPFSALSALSAYFEGGGGVLMA